MKSNFLLVTSPIKLFFAEKGNLKIFGFENAMERGIRKNYHFRKTLNCI